MLERTAALSGTAIDAATTLTRRRALFAVLVGGTMAAVLWLAAVAVPPYSAGAISFLVLFTITLPWSVMGFWNAFIGFLIMRYLPRSGGSREPARDQHPRRRTGDRIDGDPDVHPQREPGAR